MAALPGLLAPGGRAAILTFHSLEDRIVSGAFASAVASGAYAYVPSVGGASGATPSEAEVAANPRARSARLRVLQRVRSSSGAL